MSIVVYIDNASSSDTVPEQTHITQWAKLALSSRDIEKPAELSIRIVDSDEIQRLNKTYRDKNKPTNVLSFPVELPDVVELPLLGDIIVCADIVESEAKAQHKPLVHHWAHMIIHGTLHLLGYDHIEDNDAAIMEGLEIKLLQSIGIPSPY